jgi:hypothetical protein
MKIAEDSSLFWPTVSDDETLTPVANIKKPFSS